MATKHVGRIVGPPGTGKTTEVLRLMAVACAKYDFTRIGACSLTRAAVQEMRSRVARAADVEGKVNKNIKTMHAHGFSLLEMKKDQVAETHIKEWNEENPDLSMDSQTIGGAAAAAEEDGRNAMPGAGSENKSMRTYTTVCMHRLRMTPQDQWLGYERDFFKRWQSWMFRNDFVDYTGMLEQVLQRRLMPDIDVLFVDEAQDMSPLQAAIAKMWSEATESTVYAGDYQQAIFRFAGASPEVFRDLEHTWPKNLTQSYRVPKAVLDHAMAIISCAKDCEQFKYNPREGEVGELLGVMEDPDLSLDGSHMIICRYRRQANGWAQRLLEWGVPFKNDFRESERAWNPCKSQLWVVAGIYLRLMSGQNISGKEMSTLMQKIKVKLNIDRGTREDAVSSVNLSEQYNLFNISTINGLSETFGYRKRSFADLFPASKVAAVNLLQKLWEGDHEAIIKPPAVTIGTIHSVKGGEADNVWIESKMSKGQVRRSVINGDCSVNDEYRIAYVAATRARKRLGFVSLKPKGAVSPYYRLHLAKRTIG